MLSIYEDSVGTLWIGTDGGGIAKFDRDDEKFRIFSTGDRATGPGNSVRAILEDRAGALWVGTDAGLIEINKDTGSITRFDKGDSSVTSARIYSIFEDRQ